MQNKYCCVVIALSVAVIFVLGIVGTMSGITAYGQSTHNSTLCRVTQHKVNVEGCQMWNQNQLGAYTGSIRIDYLAYINNNYTDYFYWSTRTCGMTRQSALNQLPSIGDKRKCWYLKSDPRKVQWYGYDDWMQGIWIIIGIGGTALLILLIFIMCLCRAKCHEIKKQKDKEFISFVQSEARKATQDELKKLLPTETNKT